MDSLGEVTQTEAEMRQTVEESRRSFSALMGTSHLICVEKWGKEKRKGDADGQVFTHPSGALFCNQEVLLLMDGDFPHFCFQFLRKNLKNFSSSFSLLNVHPILVSLETSLIFNFIPSLLSRVDKESLERKS